MSTTKSLNVGVALAAIAAVMASGCGRTGEGGALTPLKAVQAAHARTLGAQTARVSLTSTVTSQLGGSPDVATETGVVDFGNRRATLTLTLQGVSVEKRVVESAAYVKQPGLEPRPWLKFELGKLVPVATAQIELLAQATDPSGGLDFLKGVSNVVRQLGTERVRQVETRHFQATVDLERVIPEAAASQQLRPVVDVWVDDHNLVRRLRYETAADPKQVIVEELYDFGVAVEVTAPPADQVTELLTGD